MRILRGFVQGVIDHGEGEKQFAVVGISSTSKDRHGFDQTETVAFQVSGKAHKSGLHNVYRALTGSEVFAPFTSEVDTYFKDKPRVREVLAGAPVRLGELRPEQQADRKPS